MKFYTNAKMPFCRRLQSSDSRTTTLSGASRTRSPMYLLQTIHVAHPPARLWIARPLASRKLAVYLTVSKQLCGVTTKRAEVARYNHITSFIHTLNRNDTWLRLLCKSRQESGWPADSRLRLSRSLEPRGSVVSVAGCVCDPVCTVVRCVCVCLLDSSSVPSHAHVAPVCDCPPPG